MLSFKIYTLGCKVNQYESQLIREGLRRSDFFEQYKSKADIYIINSCTVTSKAEAKSMGLISKVKKENPNCKIIFTGCLVTNKESFLRENSNVDLIVENSLKDKIPQLLKNNNDAFSETTDKEAGINDFYGHSRVFIKIQDGCSNFCAYCKIPLARGSSKSRDLKEIVDETKRLIVKGFKEIVLCGICLGAYGRDLIPKTNLSDVILALIDLKGDFRIRLSSIEAKDVSNEIIKIMANSKKLCRHLHVPFQSGDDSVLKRMNRKYTAQDYLKTVEKIRKKIPDVAITTDIMIGFPTEAEENFKNSLNFLKKVAPARTHCFPFSARPGTAAFNLNDRIPDAIVNKRMLAILKLTKRLSLDYQRKFIGKKLDVLIEAKPDRKTGFFKGYSDNYIYTLVKAKDLAPGEIVSVRAKFLNSHHLVAEVIS